MTPRVVVLGSLHMDVIAAADALPAPGASVLARDLVEAPGGKAGNQAAQLALEGVQVRLAARLGDDARGETLRAALAGRGVDLSLLQSDPQAPTGVSTVIAAAGDYVSAIHPGAAARITPEALPEPFDADALLLQLEIPVETSLGAAARARAAGANVVVNASPPGPDAARLAAAADLLVVNGAEASRLLDGAAPEAAALAARYDLDEAVVTLGPEGAASSLAGKVPAAPAAPVDAVGAGDAFLGAWLAARLRGAAPAEALARGAAAGALATEASGAFDALPGADRIEARLSAGLPSGAAPR